MDDPNNFKAVSLHSSRDLATGQTFLQTLVVVEGAVVVVSPVVVSPVVVVVEGVVVVVTDLQTRLRMRPQRLMQLSPLLLQCLLQTANLLAQKPKIWLVVVVNGGDVVVIPGVVVVVVLQKRLRVLLHFFTQAAAFDLLAQ